MANGKGVNEGTQFLIKLGRLGGVKLAGKAVRAGRVQPVEGFKEVEVGRYSAL